VSIALRSSATFATTAPTASSSSITVDVPKPTGVTNGDLLVISLSRQTDTASGTQVTWSCPGFTTMSNATPAGVNAQGGAVMYKVVTDAASEPATYTVTLGLSTAVSLNIAGGVTCWSGVHNVNPIDVAASVNSGTSTNPQSSSTTTVTDGATLVVFQRVRRALTFTQDAAMDAEVFDVASSGGTAANLSAASLAYDTIPTAGATGTRTSTISGGIAREWQATSFALRSASVNTPPTANAGPDQNVAPGSTVTLTGLGSSDPDAGDTRTYAWTQTAGPAVTLSSSTAAQPTFTAPAVVGGTSLTFSLVVTDNHGGTSSADAVTIAVASRPYRRIAIGGVWVNKAVRYASGGTWQ
jgi:hypothetical protein